MVLVDSGQYQWAMDHLAEHEKQIVDKLALQETRGNVGSCVMHYRNEKGDRMVLLVGKAELSTQSLIPLIHIKL